MIEIDIAIEADGWPAEERLRAMAARAFAATVEAADLEPAFTVSLLFTGDGAMRDLNREWRGKDKATNVLSFPAPDTPSPDGMVFFGDIALGLETVQAECAAEGKAFDHHLTHLLVHGLLHLAGYDHEDDEEAIEMEGLERAVLARLAIADPYAIED
jgi:probable rRNA maturation factor